MVFTFENTHSNKQKINDIDKVKDLIFFLPEASEVDPNLKNVQITRQMMAAVCDGLLNITMRCITQALCNKYTCLNIINYNVSEWQKSIQKNSKMTRSKRIKHNLKTKEKRSTVSEPGNIWVR